jgi:hypothetical protein
MNWKSIGYRLIRLCKLLLKLDFLEGCNPDLIQSKVSGLFKVT